MFELCHGLFRRDEVFLIDGVVELLQLSCYRCWQVGRVLDAAQDVIDFQAVAAHSGFWRGEVFDVDAPNVFGGGDDDGRMGGGDDLDFGECLAQGVDDVPLPAWVEVHVEFVDEDEPGGICDVCGEGGVEDGHAVGDVEDHPDEGLVACTQCRDGHDGAAFPVKQLFRAFVVEDGDIRSLELGHRCGDGLLDGFVFADGFIGLPGDLFHARAPFEHEFHAGAVAHAVDVACAAADFFAGKSVALFFPFA